MPATARARVGIDIGGTFTDAVLDDGGRLHVAKVRSTGLDAAVGCLQALDELLRRSGRTAPELGYLAHGATVATNAVVQSRLARVGLLTNAGFRDILEIGTQQRRQVYDLSEPQPAPIVPRERCHEVRGRLGPDGAETEPLNEDDVAAAAAALRAQAVEAVAVVLLFAFANPAHERRAAEILERELPGIPVTLSSRVAPEFREYLRASTTALNAALLPVAGRYLRGLSERLAQAGARAPLHLMQSNGGVATVEAAADLPVTLVASGPAAGVIAAARVGEAVGEAQVLSLDMGGTTADVALVVDGLPQLRFAGEQAGHPVNLPQIDVLSVGAGGGSIAAVDPFGSLAVGPQSAGAEPGPASYGTGGALPTVTDAHAVLGTLDPARPLGGAVRLDVAQARAAVERHVGAPLGLDAETSAEAILRIANANLGAALRLVSVARGHDPRTFALVALGGAGPMHACAVAEELGIPRVLVPRHSGVAAALGLLHSDVRHDLRLSWLRATAEVDVADLDAAVAGLEAEGARLLGAAGQEDGRAALEFELDMRYRGQAYNLTVPLPPRPVTAESLAAAEAAFHEAHRQAYDYTPAATETEIVTLRARALGRVPRDESCTAGDGRPLPPRERLVWYGGAPRAFMVLDRAALQPGDVVAGGTIVEQEDATTVVPPVWRGRVVAADTLVLERAPA